MNKYLQQSKKTIELITGVTIDKCILLFYVENDFVSYIAKIHGENNRYMFVRHVLSHIEKMPSRIMIRKEELVTMFQYKDELLGDEHDD